MNSNLDPSVIRPFPLFSRINDSELGDVLRSAVGRRYRAGVSVFEQGQPAQNFFLLTHGRLRVTQVTSEGQQIVVRMVTPGDLFGIARALRRSDYPATSTAVIESVALAWPTEIWDELMGRHPTLAVTVLETVGGRLQESHTRLRELATEEVERRIAHTVLRLASQAGKKEPGGVRIDFPVSRQDIAEMAGTTLHTVSRILSAWEEAELVQGGRQKLLVKDAHQLMLIGDGRVPGLLSPTRRQ